MKNSDKKITAEELDAKFDAGEEDIIEHFDTDNTLKRVNVDFPLWMLQELDSEAQRLGIPRQAVIKSWVDEAIDRKRFRAKMKEKYPENYEMMGDTLTRKA